MAQTGKSKGSAKAKAPASAKKKASPRKAAKSVRMAKSAAAGAKFVTAASLRQVRISPRKARLVVNLIKGMQIDPALQTLQYSPKKAARMCLKLLKSAISNAREKGGVDIDDLWVIGGKVDMGRTLKRWMAAAHGRASPIQKRASHITLYVGERGASLP